MLCISCKKRLLLQGIVAKKRTFYGMKVKTLKRKFSDIRSRLLAVRHHLSQPYADRIYDLCYAVKEVQTQCVSYFSI